MKVSQVVSSLIILKWWQTGVTLTAELLDRPPHCHNQSMMYIPIDKISIMAHISDNTAIPFGLPSWFYCRWSIKNWLGRSFALLLPHPTPFKGILPPKDSDSLRATPLLLPTNQPLGVKPPEWNIAHSISVSAAWSAWNSKQGSPLFVFRLQRAPHCLPISTAASEVRFYTY